MKVTEFPDVIAWLSEWLPARLAANGYPYVGVSDKYRTEPGAFVWLQLDGGTLRDVACEVSRVRVVCFRDGSDDDAATTFAQRVSAIMRAAVNQGPVRRVEVVAGPQPIVPSVRPQVYMTFDLTTVGSALTVS